LTAQGVAGGGLVTVAEAARQFQISRQAMTKQVNQFESAGQLVVVTRGRQRLVNLDDLRRVRDAVTDPVQQQRAAGQSAGAGVSGQGDLPARGAGDYNSARTERERAQAEIAKMNLAERRGELRSVREVEAAVIACGEIITREWLTLPQFADELAAAATKHGADGVRKALKQIGRDGMQRISDALEKLAGNETDDSNG
jgi:monoamine oxidase